MFPNRMNTTNRTGGDVERIRRQTRRLGALLTGLAMVAFLVGVLAGPAAGDDTTTPSGSQASTQSGTSQPSDQSTSSQAGTHSSTCNNPDTSSSNGSGS